MSARIIKTDLKEVSPSLRELLARVKENPPGDVENTKPAHIHLTVGDLIGKLQRHDPSLIVYIEDKGEWLNHMAHDVRKVTHTSGMGVTESFVVLRY